MAFVAWPGVLTGQLMHGLSRKMNYEKQAVVKETRL